MSHKMYYLKLELIIKDFQVCRFGCRSALFLPKTESKNFDLHKSCAEFENLANLVFMLQFCGMLIERSHVMTIKYPPKVII